MQFLYGAFGACIQDIILFFSKRFTAPALDFNVVQYGAALLIYTLAAGGVASIYPYRGARTPWKAFVAGLLLPTIIGGVLAAGQRGGGGQIDMTVRGPPAATDDSEASNIEGDLYDLLALF